MTPTKFRKKPVEIEAMQLTRTNVDEVASWCGGQVIRLAKPSDPSDVYIALDIPTLEGKMRADTFHSSTYSGGEYHGGDYIIRGVQGEFYPCKPDIFAATYEPVHQVTHGVTVTEGERIVPLSEYLAR
ncbi:hypothetical protein [Frigoribacterium sp. CFBP9030]|uniref:hypothetical protein n=1 Tax=Frigoribacterium sp. CFBP9030 TaxID=3096537 RepID=UPI002A6A8687|nr:hypothetical protein [Frigoribacterium sp. CFBP9030]MDY0891868.1 hypothetical protein [Frigoribacterium sp. CFBP9030]